MLFTLARSDGDQSKWPVADTHIPHPDRSVNKYVPCLTDDDPKLKLWKSKIGQALAVHTGREPSKEDALTELPPGYRLFIHLSISKKSTAARKDVYMFGRPDGMKYRSPNEFLEHALWLYPEEEQQPCKCGYCTGGGIGRTYLVKAKDGSLKRANEINLDRSLSDIYKNLANGRAYIPAEISRPRRPRREKPKGKGKARAEGGMGVLPAELERPKQRTDGVQFVAGMRSKDASENRIFRQGELVWVPISPISRWPANSNASSSHPELTPESQTIYYWPALIQKTNYNPPPPFVDDQEEGSSSTRARRTESFWSYRVNLFTIKPDDSGPDFTDDQLLPFLSFSPHKDVTASVGEALQRSQEFPHVDVLKWKDIKDDWDKVVVYYAAAVSAAEDSTKAWALTNEYKVLLDEDNPATRQYFQGLWWGAERMWLGDLVRLLVAHKHINLPVVAPGSDEEGLYPSRGGEDGPIFFFLEGIVLDPTEGRERDEKGLVSGKLFELVDENDVEMEVEELVGGVGGVEEFVETSVSPTKSNGTTVVEPEPEPANAVASSSAIPLTNGHPPPPTNPTSSSNPSSLSKQQQPTTTDPAPPAPKPSAFLTSLTSPLLFKDQKHPLPLPPRGKKFRILHSQKIMITFTLSVVAGRYYPLVDLTSTFRGEAIRSVAKEVNGEGSSSSYSAAVPSPKEGGDEQEEEEEASTVARYLRILAGGNHGSKLGGLFMAPNPLLKRETRLEIVNEPLNAAKDKIRAVWKVLHRNDKGFEEEEEDEGMEMDEFEEEEMEEEEGEGRPRKFARMSMEEDGEE